MLHQRSLKNETYGSIPSESMQQWIMPVLSTWEPLNREKLARKVGEKHHKCPLVGHDYFPFPSKLVPLPRPPLQQDTLHTRAIMSLHNGEAAFPLASIAETSVRPALRLWSRADARTLSLFADSEGKESSVSSCE